MGNSQSALSTRKDAVSQEPQANEDVVSPGPSGANVTSTSTQTPAEAEESDASQRVVGRRRSLITFPSMRRRSRNIMALKDEGQDAPDHGLPSSSRRRWRAFSGLKSRPVSTMTDSNSPAIDPQPPHNQESYNPEIPDAPKDKGKEREVEAVAASQSDDPGPQAAEPMVNAPGPSHPVVEAGESAFSSDAVLRGLRELQDIQSMGNDSQSPRAPESDSATLSQVDRPPTPIPTSAIDITPELGQNDTPESGSHAALIEALGSWMGGRPRGDNVESMPNDTSSSRPWSAGPSAPHRPPPNAGHNDSELLGSFGRNSSHVASALGSPPVSSASGTRIAQNPAPPPTLQDRRTLPPAGTGTLVVVQGVVHTTDVRHPYPPVASSVQPTATSWPPRSTSSTPTLRASTPTTASQSPSRASTPQPQPSSGRRGRFSSFTNGLRPRSRPRTSPAPRNHGTGGWRHSFVDTDGGNPSETASEHSAGFRLGLGQGTSTSESETASTFLSAEPSSSSASASRDGSSVPMSLVNSSQLDSQCEAQNDRDAPVPDDSQSRTEDERNLANGESEQANGGDGHPDEESEEELSASSIEVLGTLLSVATAATAASLVTGTTDPLFSSGLTGPLANGRNTASSPTNVAVSSPLQPVPSPTSQETSAENSNGEPAANTGMRAAWENLRDRFSRTRGRREAGVPGGEVREDPREQMLREMARAFTTGLGLDAAADSEPRTEQREGGAGQQAGREASAVHDAASSSESSTPASTSRPASEPESLGPSPGPGPEGSFERFLHNLQVDLRTALTEDYAERRARAQAHGVHATNISTATQTAPAEPFDPSRDAESVRRRHEDRVSAPSDGDPPVPDLVPTIPNTPRTANLDLPTLPGDANRRPRGGPGFGPTPQAQGITGQPGAGINWWRLYRFPPMHLAPHPTTAAGVPAPPPQSAYSGPLAAPSSEQLSPTPVSGTTERRSPDSAASSGTTDTTAPSQDVVPVIVVGLQSVPVNRVGVHHHHHGPPPPFGTPPSTNDASLGAEVPTDTPGRDRAWPLRAASRAFGRMGRRNEADPPADAGTTPPAETGDADPPRAGRHGGRTYLIFVIGGYYPPNHSIVTGADDMNSFEALWELAELLGQVKPPVASKEDIDKSGLEIIKASGLPDYEKAGKVASNTVERCLICLDDYESEDNLRLLSCRHIFHKQCVDKWLEQGRNNCPACRTKGVRTGDEPQTSPVSDVASTSPLGNLD